MKFDFDFLKDRYDYELQRRYLFWSRLALFAVLVLTTMMGIPYVVDQVRY